MLRSITFLLIVSAMALPAAAGESRLYGIDLYGRSYHHDLPAGERDRLNEANIGFALRSTVYLDRHSFSVDAGTFLNSYYDTAFWVGAEYRYRWFKYIEPGLMVRHWETTNGTYPEKDLNKYLTVTVPVSEWLSVSAIVRSSGYIAFITIPLGKPRSPL